MNEIFQARTVNPFFKSDFIFNLSALGRQQKIALEVIHKFSGDIIRDRMSRRHQTESRKSKHVAFLDTLLDVRTVECEPLSFEDIQEEVDTFIFGGHDTTAAALTWTSYQLGRHQEVQVTYNLGRHTGILSNKNAS